MYAIFKERIIEKAKEVYHRHCDFNAGNIDLEQLCVHQSKKLREIVKYAVENSHFYRLEALA